MELVSAIIPAYNAAGTLPRALDSMLAQTYPHIECLVVDDGSTDGTEALVTSQYPQVRYLRQENQGPSAARNAAASVARGDYLAFLDADDAWLPEKTARQMAVFSQHRSAAVVSCHRVRVNLDTAGRELDRRPSRRADGQLEPITFAQQFWGNKICGAASIVRRATFEQCGGYDAEVHIGEDLDLWLRIMAEGHEVLVLREPLYVFYHSSGSQRENLDKLESSWTRILRKWDPDHNPRTLQLISRERYRETCKWWWLKLSYHALRMGDRPRAARFARQAAQVATANGFLQSVGWLARSWPGGFYLAGTLKGFPRMTG